MSPGPGAVEKDERLTASVGLDFDCGLDGVAVGMIRRNASDPG